MNKIKMGAMIALGSLLLAGCASKPEEIQANYVSPLKYKEYSCKQISMELEHVSKETGNLYMTLKEKADDDAAQMGVGLILFWPTLFFLEGGDGPEANQYATLKGEYEALRKSAVNKECSMAEMPPSPEDIIKVKREEAKKKEKELAKERLKNFDNNG
mgnify:CR=1 FL=1